jgi:hypothetical protein
MIQMGASETMSNSPALFNRMVDQTTDLVMAGFGRAEEAESDQKGLELANEVGYDPQGLNRFLTRLTERNEGSEQRQGLFASHPEMQERLEANARTIRDKRLTGTATLADRFNAAVSYETPALTAIAQVEAGSAGLAGGGEAESAKKDDEEKQGEQKKRGFGLSALARPGGGEQRSTEVTGSGASRGVDTELNARGGSNPAPVSVTITPDDIAQFKKDGNLG